MGKTASNKVFYLPNVLATLNEILLKQKDQLLNVSFDPTDLSFQGSFFLTSSSSFSTLILIPENVLLRRMKILHLLNG